MKKNYNLRKGIFLLLSLMAFSYAAQAQTSRWTGNGMDNLWSNPANWMSTATPPAANPVPDNNDTALFDGSADVTVVLNANTTVKILDIRANVTIDIGSHTLNVVANSNPVRPTAHCLEIIGSGIVNITPASDRDAVQFRGDGGKFTVGAGVTVNLTGDEGFTSQSSAANGQIFNSGVINLDMVTGNAIELNSSDPLTLVNEKCAVINLGENRIFTHLTATGSNITNNGLITYTGTSASGGILLRVGSTATNNGFYDYSNSANFATGNQGIGTLTDNGIELNPPVSIDAGTTCGIDLTSATSGMVAYDWAFGGTTFGTNDGGGLLDLTNGGFPNEAGPHTITVDCFPGANVSIDVTNVCEASVIEVELPISSCDIVRLRNVETGEYLTAAGGSAQPVTMSDLGEPGDLDCMPDSEASQNTHWSLVESGDFINIDSRSETGGTGILRAPGGGGPGGPFVVVSTTSAPPSTDNDKIWTVLYDANTDTYRFASTTPGRFLYHNPDGTVTHSPAPSTDNRSVWEAIPLEACISIIDDPCACSDEMNYLLNGEYYFHEVVEITSTTCSQWDMVSITSGQAYDANGNILPLPLTGTETPAGSGIFLFEFWHISGDGFSANFTEVNTSEMLSIGNVCEVPPLDVVCPASNDLGTFNCNTMADIPDCPADEASAEAAPYGLTIESCGDIVVLCTDDAMIDNCVVGNQTITRTITILEDLNGNGTTDAGESTVDCEFTLTIEPDMVDPTIDTEAMDMTVECDGAGNTAALDAWLASNGGAAASDVCGGVIFTNNFTALSDDCGATGSAMVTFTATDDCGNTAATTASFIIEDTTDPVITCPADQFLTCSDDPLPLALTIADFITIGGTISDDCSELSELTIGFTNSPIGKEMLNFCADDPADRTLTRTYTITDACGNASTCEQNFIYDQITTGPVITAVPSDQTIDCAVNAIPQPHLFAFTTECAVEATVTVSESSSGTPGCNGSTIAYTYTITDACGRSAEAVQTYTLANDGPDFVCPAEICVIECPADTDEIQAQFDSYADLAVVNTSCAETSVSITNNFNSNGFITQNCANPTVAVDGAVAYQVVSFTATDACGRSAVCTALVVIKDMDGPVINGTVSFGLADCNDADLEEGYTDWATSQLNSLSATDECSNGAVTLSYSPLVPNMDCTSGLASTEVSFIATDNCGNSTIQTTVYQIIDNGTSEPLTATVSGNLYTEDNEMIALANVAVDGFMNNQMTTNDDGYYNFDLAMAQNYSIEPTRNDDPLNGITTYDLILLGQHLLELNLLDSPYKLIAADVNESGSITASDMIQLRRLILNIDDELSAGRSWTFVDAAYVFPNLQNPFATTYPTAHNINNLTDAEIANFIGVKLGDLNASANPTLLQAGDTRSADGELKFKLKDQMLKAGQSYELTFKATDFKDVSGFQFTLDFDADLLELIDYQHSELTKMTANNFGFAKSDEGKITVSWNEMQAISMVDDATLFSLKFTAIEQVKLSEVLAINSSITANEVYQAGLRKEAVLDFGKTNAGEKEFVLLQNQPNPFRQQTMIGFQLAEAAEATLTIFDVAGRIVWSQSKSYESGMHQVMMNKSDFGAPGVYYYQLSTGKHLASRKMILLR